jgi:hypothetical protein
MIGALKQLEAGRKAEDVAREVGGVEADDLRVESEVRRDGCEPGAGSQAPSGPKLSCAEKPSEPVI